jgi:hypothetical protein
MKYVCLVYHEEAKLASLTERELESLVEECAAWVEELALRGRHVFSTGLQSIRTAATLRSRNGNLSLTDGPFAESKEFLGGFTILDARDLNEAVQVAAQLPAVRLGSIEVRPLLEGDADLADPLDRKLGAALRLQRHPCGRD